MNETRYWAKLSNWEDGSARYLVPTVCQECNLELHAWREEDGDLAVYTLFPQHREGLWFRLKHAWHYIKTGYWANDIMLDRQDVENLRAVLELVLQPRAEPTDE